MNSPQTEEARKSIRPAYQGLAAKLQHVRISRLDEDAGVATGFRSMKGAARFQLQRNAASALADVVAPWDQPGYMDGRLVG